MSLGLFIELIDIGGSEADEQIRRLRKRLEAGGGRVVVTREPGGSPKSEEIRAFLDRDAARELAPFRRAVLLAASRIDLLDTAIAPALRKGMHVLCARTIDVADSHGLAPGLAETLDRVASNGLRPHLTLLLDDAPEQAMLPRVGSFGTDMRERSLPEEGEKVRRLDRFKSVVGPCEVIASDRSQDDVERAIWAAVISRFPRLADKRKELRNGA